MMKDIREYFILNEKEELYWSTYSFSVNTMIELNRTNFTKTCTNDVTLTYKISFGVICACLCLLTIMGNLLVLIIFRRIRTVSTRNTSSFSDRQMKFFDKVGETNQWLDVIFSLQLVKKKQSLSFFSHVFIHFLRLAICSFWVWLLPISLLVVSSCQSPESMLLWKNGTWVENSLFFFIAREDVRVDQAEIVVPAIK